MKSFIIYSLVGGGIYRAESRYIQHIKSYTDSGCIVLLYVEQGAYGRWEMLQLFVYLLKCCRKCKKCANSVVGIVSFYNYLLYRDNISKVINKTSHY